MTDAKTRHRHFDRRRQMVRDLAELEEQVLDGDIEADAADHLRATYRAELTELTGLILTMEVPNAPADRLASPSAGYGAEGRQTGEAAPMRGLSTRTMAVAAAILITLTGAIIYAGRGTDPQGTTSAGIASTAAGSIDVEAMSTEELEGALDSFPNSPAVRMALADRYLDDGNSQAALAHYLKLTEEGSSATDPQKSTAFARVGYLAYATGQYQVAKQSLEDSLDLDPGNIEATLYTGYVLFNGFGDKQGAVPYLEKALAEGSMPAPVAAAVQEMISEANQG